MIPNTIEELNRIRNSCKSIVNERATISAVLAIVPVPGVDVSADVIIMTEILPKINRKFGLSPEQIEELDPEIKAKLIVIITSIGSQLIGKVITKEAIMILLKKIGAKVTTKQLTKYIPFIGPVISSTVSFFAMKHLGNSHIDDCYEVCRKAIEEM